MFVIMHDHVQGGFLTINFSKFERVIPQVDAKRTDFMKIVRKLEYTGSRLYR